MKEAYFVVKVADLEGTTRRWSRELPLPFLTEALAETEANPTAPGRLDLQLSKSAAQVLVRGTMTAEVTMPSAVDLEPIPVTLEPEVFLVLDPAPPQKNHAGSPRRQRAKLDTRPVESGRESRVASQPSSRPARLERIPEAELSDVDAGRDTYQGDQIVLDSFLREYLLLELPIAPAQSDLRAEPMPAIPAALTESKDPLSDDLDPRLRPLVEIAHRLTKKNKE